MDRKIKPGDLVFVMGDCACFEVEEVYNDEGVVSFRDNPCSEYVDRCIKVDREDVYTFSEIRLKSDTFRKYFPETHTPPELLESEEEAMCRFFPEFYVTEQSQKNGGKNGNS